MADVPRRVPFDEALARLVRQQRYKDVQRSDAIPGQDGTGETPGGGGPSPLSLLYRFGLSLTVNLPFQQVGGSTTFEVIWPSTPFAVPEDGLMLLFAQATCTGNVRKRNFAIDESDFGFQIQILRNGSSLAVAADVENVDGVPGEDTLSSRSFHKTVSSTTGLHSLTGGDQMQLRAFRTIRAPEEEDESTLMVQASLIGVEIFVG